MTSPLVFSRSLSCKLLRFLCNIFVSFLYLIITEFYYNSTNNFLATSRVLNLLAIVMKGWIREGPKMIMIQCGEYNNIVIMKYLGHPPFHVSFNSYFGYCQPLSGPHYYVQIILGLLSSLPCLNACHSSSSSTLSPEQS